MPAEKKQIVKLDGGIGSPTVVDVIPLNPDGVIDDPEFMRKAAQMVYSRLTAARAGGEAGLERLERWHEELLAAGASPRFQEFLPLLQDSWLPEAERARQLPDLLHGMRDLWRRVQEADAKGELHDPSDVKEPMRKGIVPEQFFSRYLEAALALTVAQVWEFDEKRRSEPRSEQAAEEGSIEAPASLAIPKNKALIIPAPRIVQMIQEFCATGGARVPLVAVIDPKNGNVGGLLYRKEKVSEGLMILNPTQVPDNLRNAHVEKELLREWALNGLKDDLDLFDDKMWDLIALALAAFYNRTQGKKYDESFPLLVDDYFEWRNMDPRKRTDDERREAYDRIALACSGRFQATGTATLHISSLTGKGRKRQTFDIAGPVLVRHYDYYRRGQTRLQLTGTDRPDGVHISLGLWARHFVEEDATLGIFIRRLAQYDLRRQLWERRLGWYLLFQLQNQWNNGRHPLKTETLLNGTRIPWKDLAKKNVQRVINQLVAEVEGDTLKKPGALENLKRDGIIRDYRCLDDNPYGLGLGKSRRERWLQYRWDIDPGPELERHLVGKQKAATKAREAARKRQEQGDRKALQAGAQVAPTARSLQEKGGQP